MGICGQRHLRSVILAFCVAACVAFAAAQESPRAHFSVPHTLILPSKVIAGAPATLAVLDAAGRLVPDAVVEVPGGQKVTTDATGRALFMVPGQPGAMTARVSNLNIRASATVLTSPASQAYGSAETSSPELRIVSYPALVAIHDRFTIEGTGFRGAADSNRVFLGDQLCVVVASSPVSLVILPGPHTPIGAVDLHVSVAGRDTGLNPVSAVLLDFSGPPEIPKAGAQAKLTVRVHGTTQRVAIEVRNWSPGIIQFAGGKVQRLTTSGGEQNISQVDMKFLASGDYTVTARLIPTDYGSPPGSN